MRLGADRILRLRVCGRQNVPCISGLQYLSHCLSSILPLSVWGERNFGVVGAWNQMGRRVQPPHILFTRTFHTFTSGINVPVSAFGRFKIESTKQKGAQPIFLCRAEAFPEIEAEREARRQEKAREAARKELEAQLGLNLSEESRPLQIPPRPPQTQLAAAKQPDPRRNVLAELRRGGRARQHTERVEAQVRADVSMGRDREVPEFVDVEGGEGGGRGERRKFGNPAADPVFYGTPAAEESCQAQPEGAEVRTGADKAEPRLKEGGAPAQGLEVGSDAPPKCTAARDPLDHTTPAVLSPTAGVGALEQIAGGPVGGGLETPLRCTAPLGSHEAPETAGGPGREADPTAVKGGHTGGQSHEAGGLAGESAGQSSAPPEAPSGVRETAERCAQGRLQNAPPSGQLPVSSAPTLAPPAPAGGTTHPPVAAPADELLHFLLM